MTLHVADRQREADTSAARRRPHRAASLIALALITGAVLSLIVASGNATIVRFGALLPPPTPAASVPAAKLQPVSYWEQQYLQIWADVSRDSLPQSTSADSWDHYNLSYNVDSDTAMYLATGNAQYIDRALLYVNNVVATARPSSSMPTSQYHDGYFGWISRRADLQPTGIEVPLYESYFWRYATTMLRVIRQTPQLYGNPTYRAQYERLLNFAEVNVFQKWYTRGANDNIYRSNANLVSHWALIALNLSLITEDANRRAIYRTVVDNIDLHLPNASSSLRDQLRPNPVAPWAYFWDGNWGSSKRPGQDVSHGNNVIAYLVEARDHGHSWTAMDMQRFSALLTTVIWPRDNVFADFVDGTGQGNGWFSDGWVKLGRYSPAVQQRLEHHTVVNIQFIANMALNAKILS
jgi:hypothetical protein